MNATVVFSHPEPTSLNGAFLDAVVSGLRSNSSVDAVDVIDLYAEGFDPVLRFGKDRPRRDLHKDAALERHREAIAKADLLAFVYPIWWARPPAMLLGFLDRIMAKDFAYRYRGGLPEGLLGGKSAVCVSTMKGPTGYPFLLLGNAHKNLMRRALFGFVGIKKTKFFEMGGMEIPGGKQERNLARVKKWFASAMS